MGVFYTRFSKPRASARARRGDDTLREAVAYFVMVWIGKSERREVLRTHIVETAKRIYGAPEFFYYALADGIQKLFTRFGKWSAKLDLKKVLQKPSPQLEFAFVGGDG